MVGKRLWWAAVCFSVAAIGVFTPRRAPALLPERSRTTGTSASGDSSTQHWDWHPSRQSSDAGQLDVGTTASENDAVSGRVEL